MPDRLGAAAAGPVLILAPTGRDAQGAAALLNREGIISRICPDFDALCAVIGEDTGMVLVADEALARASLDRLSGYIGTQPPWSDLPFMVLTQSGAAARRTIVESQLPEILGNVLFLERPLNAISLLSAVRSALRARRRQRQVNGYLLEQQRAEAALLESEARFRHMADNAPVMIWTAEPSGSCNWLSRSWYAFTGQVVAEGLGSDWYAAVHPADRTRLRQVFEDAAVHRTFAREEYRLRKTDGTYAWVLAATAPRFGEDGTYLGYIGSMLDISDRRETEERLRIAQRAGRVGTFELDPVARVCILSEEFCRLWGLPQMDRMPLDALLDMMHPEDRMRVATSHPDLLPDALAYDEYRVMRADTGEMRWLGRRAEAKWDATPGSMVFLGVVYDITDRKRLEGELLQLNDALERRVEERTAELMAAEAALHQAQKMEAVGQLTGGIAHDFNNMLQAISGSLELMRRRVTQGRVAEIDHFLDGASRTVERAAALTHRLLAFARRQALQPITVEPGQLVKGMTELIRGTVGPSITVELRSGNAQWSVLCDPNQLENALLNLAINARDAMPKGGILTFGTEDVHLRRADVVNHDGAKPGDYVVVAVADTGGGMDEATRMRAFEPFFTTKPLGQGTGLGLSQLYGFVQQSGGLVRLDSAPGQGTTVRLYLPRHERVEQPDEAPAAQLADVRPADRRATVLLVEDEVKVRESAAEMLREMGYAVLEAGDGNEALRLLRHSSVDVMVTDVGLPNGMNGRQIAEAARERRSDLPVLFVTGYAGTSLDGQLDPGMAVISKPFSLAILAERVQAMLADVTTGGVIHASRID
ncbi:MAG: PAS domain-containing protein [Janthinobacterium lividum]